MRKMMVGRLFSELCAGAKFSQRLRRDGWRSLVVPFRQAAAQGKTPQRIRRSGCRDRLRGKSMLSSGAEFGGARSRRHAVDDIPSQLQAKSLQFLAIAVSEKHLPAALINRHERILLAMLVADFDFSHLPLARNLPEQTK
jgi:hypothetical protein